jgi:hypothetical protein
VESDMRRNTATTHGSPRGSGCASEADLICLISGELTEGEIREISLHIKGCANCQASLRTLRVVFQSCALAVGQEEGQWTAPAAKRATFRRLLAHQAETDAARRMANVRRLLPVAAALLAAFLPIALMWAKATEAESVVRRAVAQESQEHVIGGSEEPLRFLWIPSTGESRGGISDRAAGATLRPLDASELTREIAALLDADGFNRREPLSATRAAAWRAAQREREDVVSRRGGLLYVRTAVAVGRLREVTVVVREEDWQVVGQSWVFFGLGRLEVERLGTDAFGPVSNVGVPHAGAATQ